MNSIFEVPGCEICAEIEPAVMFANVSLPIEDQIILVNAHMGASQLRFLKLFSQGNRYSLPDGFITKMENVRGNKTPQITRVMGSSTSEIDERVLLGLLGIPTSFLDDDD